MSGSADADIVVVGSGPSGLGAAIALRSRGFEKIVVLDREPVAGGIPRHCEHPTWGIREFGWPMKGSQFARRLVARATKMGIEIRTLTTVVALRPGGTLDITDEGGTRSIQARRIILANGARETPRSARLVSGDRPLGILNVGALQSLIYLKQLKPFERPLIVGTELVSLSALNTCIKNGIKPVAMIEARARPVARWPLSLYPRLERVPFYLGTQLLEIQGRDRVERVKLLGPDKVPFELECDGVLFTGGFTPETGIIRNSHLAFDARSRGPMVDQYGRCSDPSIYAAGNVLRPIETGSWCYREGLRTGHTVADDLEGKLPQALRTVPIEIGDGISYAIPGQIALAGDRLDAHIQLRVQRAVAGSVIVEAGEDVILRRRLLTRPERRIVLKLKEASVPQNCSRLHVGLKLGHMRFLSRLAP
ncbi:hypothetical protein K32_38690 [Kaistia sp. 32K]|uniref:NAD(P)/FAD-dependent oxidoreductase n=1 Tax=Kaistia sp. 32K TaxID=2795690 RepID=UPI0019153F2D|nr:FAD-dependent oxidoreductase [Kaistia sp. 32K]BCP55252.1 hypothetical protein K32_38690 [Kaistia sp. 32K]